METFTQLKKSLDQVENLEKEIQNLKNSLKNLLDNEKLEKFLDPEEYNKRKRRDRNKRYYHNRLKK